MQSRKLTQGIDRLESERQAAALSAERAKRPECREADRVAGEENAIAGNGLTPLLDIVGKLHAGMRIEACAVARKTFTSAERLRSAAARCDPAEAITFHQLAASLRDIILEQGC